jgi:hypothetical protein
MMFRQAATALTGLALLAACATPPPVDPKASVVPASALKSDGSAGTATVHAIFPCHLSDMMTPVALRTSGWEVLIDGKKAANLNSCEFREITVPAGKHAIRLANPYFDLGGLFSDGDPFALPASGQAYFVVVTEVHGTATVHYFKEFGAAEAKSVIAAIKSNTKAR